MTWPPSLRGKIALPIPAAIIPISIKFSPLGFAGTEFVITALPTDNLVHVSIHKVEIAERRIKCICMLSDSCFGCQKLHCFETELNASADTTYERVLDNVIDFIGRHYSTFLARTAEVDSLEFLAQILSGSKQISFQTRCWKSASN